jgi:hypothetical protein
LFFLEHINSVSMIAQTQIRFFWKSQFIAGCGLEQSPDLDGQEGEAEHQQAGNPQEGQEVFATKSVCRPEMGTFSRVQIVRWHARLSVPVV